MDCKCVEIDRRAAKTPRTMPEMAGEGNRGGWSTWLVHARGTRRGPNAGITRQPGVAVSVTRAAARRRRASQSVAKMASMMNGSTQ